MRNIKIERSASTAFLKRTWWEVWGEQTRWHHTVAVRCDSQLLRNRTPLILTASRPHAYAHTTFKYTHDYIYLPAWRCETVFKEIYHKENFVNLRLFSICLFSILFYCKINNGNYEFQYVIYYTINVLKSTKITFPTYY